VAGVSPANPKCGRHGRLYIILISLAILIGRHHSESPLQKMTRCLLAVGAAAIFFSADLRTLALPPLERSVSTSRQFIVYSGDARVRAAVCNVAERAKSSVLALLQQSDQWKTPIVVNAQGPQANLPELPVAALNLSQTGFGLKLQLDLTIGAEVEAPAIERELLRAILVEIVYRREPNLPAGTAYVQPPEWLVEGIQAWGSQLGPAEFGAPLRNTVSARKVVSLQDFLRQRPDLLDSPSREVYRSYSYALVSLLKNGKELAKFIADLSEAPADTFSDLIAHFKILGGSIENAERVWNTRVAQLATSNGYESFTVSETERRLETLLHFQFPKSKQPENFWKLEQYPDFIRLPNRAAVLNALSENLMVLGVRANPVCRPVILEYQQIAFTLARGKTSGIGRRLARLSNAREKLISRVQEIDDYMNWFEATQSSARSGTFIEYLKAVEETATTHRHDAISIYLDSIENQMRD
jgi:hypothetical protein